MMACVYYSRIQDPEAEGWPGVWSQPGLECKTLLKEEEEEKEEEKE